MGVMHFYLTAIQTRLQAQAAGVSYNGLCRMASLETVCVGKFRLVFPQINKCTIHMNSKYPVKH